MDDPERYSCFDSTPAVNGEFIKTDDYIAIKLRLTEENKMLREALNAIASMSTDRKSIQVATEALEQIK
jgi:hypothetical protein